MWLHDPAKKKGVSPKLQLRWKGPFLIVSKLSDVTMRIQMSPRAKPMVVHDSNLAMVYSRKSGNGENRLTLKSKGE